MVLCTYTVEPYLGGDPWAKYDVAAVALECDADFVLFKLSGRMRLGVGVWFSLQVSGEAALECDANFVGNYIEMTCGV